MPDIIYWGDGGQFGPFSTQEDGWPNAGQVMRYFREKAGITARAFGKLYGKKIREGGKPICERWILEMELENRVPSDITRRRVIADLLEIPPVLFGLASLADLTMEMQKRDLPHQKVPNTSILKASPVDIARYEKNVRMALQLHRTSSARELLQDINADRKDLESIESQTRGNLLHRVRELLVANTLLAAKIMRDQQQYIHAYTYANFAVQVAARMEDADLIATTMYTRGCIQLQWGQFAVVKQGWLQLDRNNIEAAAHDFRSILNLVSSQRVAIHPQLHGFTLLQLSRARSLLKQGYDRGSTRALLLADQATGMIGKDTIDDLHTRMIVTGTLSGLHQGGYYLTRADILNANGLSSQAIAELERLQKLTEKTYGQDETRNQAWTDIVLAKALVGVGEYPEAAHKVRRALITCHSIHSIQNIAIISDLFRRLTASPYGASMDVKALGDMFEEWYGLRLRGVSC